MYTKIKRKINLAISNNFVKNISKLATGTILAQVLSLIFIPILTRTYSKEAFGLLSAYLAVVGLIASFATLKYDTALVLPKEDKDAYKLLKLSNIVTVLITIICVLIMFIPIDYFKDYQGLQLFIGIGVLLSVNYNNSALWNIRSKTFNSTSISKIIQSLAVFGFQYGLFYIYDIKGLIIGNIFGVAVSGIYLLYTRKFNWKIYNSISKDEMISIGKRYIDFPKYFTVSNAILSLSASLPVLLFVNFIPLAQIGLYGISLKIIGQPVTVISDSLRSVVLGDMAKKKNNNQKILNWYQKIFTGLFIISLIASLFLVLFSDHLISLLLGSSWINASTYVKMLIPLLISLMISSPATAAVRIFEMQKYNLKYSIISLVVKAITLLGLFYLENIKFEYIILIYSIINLCIVLINNFYIVLKIKKYEKSIA